MKINEEKYPDVFSEAIVVNKHIEVLQTLLTRDIGCRPFFGVRKLWELHNFFRYINSKKKEKHICASLGSIIDRKLHGFVSHSISTIHNFDLPVNR